MNLLIFIATAAISLVLTPTLIRLASRYGISRHDATGRLRKRALTLSGGVVIYISFIAVTAIVFLFSRGRWLGSYDYNYLGVLLGGTLMLLLGLWDAVRKVPLPVKIAFQALAGVILLGCGYRLNVLTFFPGGKIVLGSAGPALLIIWVVGMTNAFALIDTIDGLAAGIAAISAIILFFAGLSGPPSVPVLALAAAGSCGGFLRYNFYPARIHLGRSGTFFLGFVLAAVAVQGALKATAGIALLLPVLALVIGMGRRIHNLLTGRDENQRPFQFTSRILRLRYSPRQTVLILYLLQANLGMIALVAAAAGRTLALGIFFLVGTMLYILFTIVEEYRSRILVLEEKEAGEAR
jgi:UDP-GlcNAc:undecaprenyl-phosphate/decaprenyl-phosphate GlcNAc-1-phosphate transferase